MDALLLVCMAWLAGWSLPTVQKSTTPFVAFAESDIQSEQGSAGINVGDMDGDGRVDIVSRQDFGFTYYYLQGPSDTWTRVLVPQATPGHGGLAVGDINRDGRPDLVENGFWLQAPADRLNGIWIKHDILGWDSGSSVGLADINHDGRLDVFLSVSGSSVGSLAWFEAPV